MKQKSALESSPALAFDSTQTLRAVTLRELQDPQQQKWFAVQLVVSDRPVNLDTMPRLDVFATHRLYAVEAKRGAATCYGLRLGFFTQEAAARVICESVRGFFRSPSVVRVSAGEQERFAGPKQPAAEAPKLVPVRHSAPAAPTAAAAPAAPKKVTSSISKLQLDQSLSRELLREARQVETSRTGSHRAVKQKSWLGKLLG